ncbi:MAG: hypothetical protein Q3962_03045 [Corynebacterium sp.]|nr:hypothetical protein [Corynebacterium sp.]
MKKRLTAAALSVVAAASLAVAAPQQAHADTSVKDVVGKILFVPASITVLVAAQIAIYNALVDARMIEPLRRL